MAGIEIPTESLHDAYERGRAEVAEWIAYADRLERVLELVCGESKDRLMQAHAEQGLRLIRPLPRSP